ncbi:MAG TPA: DUF357 domain-containing protein [Methanocorpusculum sp.]|nr:DUF357 domain-containing protein [Methanocorpusculum sp.]
MLIEELLKQYAATADRATSAVPAASLLNKVAAEILEMVRCYASDAQVFFKRGDLVNAFAAAAYGFGWLDCGGWLGFTTAEHFGVPSLEKEIPSELHEKLEEKTLRYQRMLTSALSVVSAAPDSETVSAAAAKEIFSVITSGLSFGNTLLPEDMVNALCVFSYWYGWLDCGVRAGLFTISGDRHLFTI